MVIAHLYSDLLNLYGNDGNIKMLVRKLHQIGEKVEVVYPTVNDEMDFSKYDLVYIGSGIEEYQKIAIEDLKKYKDDIKKAIKNNKTFLITGNALDMFGKELVNGNTTIKGLNIFDYNSKFVKRIRKDVVYETDFLKKPILGYENHNYVLENNENPLWDNQSIRVNNFIGTYVEGPILVRNPEFLKYLFNIIVKDKKKLDKLNLNLEEKAYKNFNKLLTEK